MKKMKILNLPLFLMVFVLLFISSCKQENLLPGYVSLSLPANSSTDVALNASLSWQAAIDPDGDAVTYDVYFGTEATPSTVASTGQTGTTYAPAFAANTTYYWKVVVKDGNGGTSESAVWSFTTDIVNWTDATHGIFSDTRDNKVYDVVKIGNQVWFAENLAYEIPGKEITNNIQWQNNAAYDGWCYYDNDKSTNGGTYGILYQWEAAKVACPVGWHLSTDDEWTTLTGYLGGESIAGGKLKETVTTHWITPNTGATNETGFTALPGGARDDNGAFAFVDYLGFWWSSTEASSTTAWYRHMNYNTSSVSKISYNKEMGASVRCVKN